MAQTQIERKELVAFIVLEMSEYGNDELKQGKNRKRLPERVEQSMFLSLYSYHHKIHPRLIREMMRMSPDQFAEILIMNAIQPDICEQSNNHDGLLVLVRHLC